MADTPPELPPDMPLDMPPVDEHPLGLAGILDEEAEWQRLMAGVHRSIERRELSGQAVEFSVGALAGVLVEYLKALASFLPGSGGRNRAE
jgi:hypothetical protein